MPAGWSPGEKASILLAVILALLAGIISRPSVTIDGVIIIILLGTLFGFLLFYMAHRIILSIYRASRTWGTGLWALAILGFSVLCYGTIFLFISGYVPSGIHGPVTSQLPAGISPTIPTVSPEKFVTYMNQTLGFSISYPVSWSVISERDPKADYVLNTKFSSNDGTAGVIVGVADITGRDDELEKRSLHDWKTRWVQMIRGRSDIFPESIIMKDEKGTYAGYPAQTLEYTYASGPGTRVHIVQALIDPGPLKGYNVAFISTAETYDRWSDTRQEVIDSFRILG